MSAVDTAANVIDPLKLPPTGRLRQMPGGEAGARLPKPVAQTEQRGLGAVDLPKPKELVCVEALDPSAPCPLDARRPSCLCLPCRLRCSGLQAAA